MTASPHILDSEAVPFVFEAYSTGAAGQRRAARHEYPMGDIVIDIDAGKAAP